jgi:hypothetical protein
MRQLVLAGFPDRVDLSRTERQARLPAGIEANYAFGPHGARHALGDLTVLYAVLYAAVEDKMVSSKKSVSYVICRCGAKNRSLPLRSIESPRPRRDRYGQADTEA